MDIQELKRTPQYINRHPWESGRAWIINYLIKNYCGSSVKNIADIGSGDAFVAQYINRKNSATIHAVDNAYDPEIIQQIKEKITANNIFFYSSVKEYNEANAAAPETVLLLDVIEHIADPAILFNELLPKSSSATWIITVPAFNFIYSEHDKQLGHHKRYNRRSIKQLLKANQLEIKDSGYFFFSLFLIRIIQKITNKKTAGVENWKAPALTSYIARCLLILDFMTGIILHKAGIHLPGLSLYVVCKPRK